MRQGFHAPSRAAASTPLCCAPMAPMWKCWPIPSSTSAILQRLPWAPSAILEGGGNIGVATLVLGHIYPDATIVVLEPQPENCVLAKANTMSLKNVHVRCEGLWRTETHLALTKAGDGRQWAWQFEETSDATNPDAIKSRQHRPC